MNDEGAVLIFFLGFFLFAPLLAWVIVEVFS